MMNSCDRKKRGITEMSHIDVMKQALEALEQWNTPLYKRGNVITALRRALEQQPCNYPNCLYPCPDLPDCKDAEDLYDLAVKADNGGQP